jgi:hypothetical protein
MSKKYISISIVILMVFTSCGTVVNSLKIENDCDCSSSEKHIEIGGSLNYLAHWKTRTTPKTKMSILGSPPSSFSWRNADVDSNGHGIANGGTNFMTSVKSQGNCGACWAFAFMGVIEAVINIEAEIDGGQRPNLDLSEQYYVSCATRDLLFCDGCRGARFPIWPFPNFMDWAIDHDVVLESCFPYQEVDSNGCNSDDCEQDPVHCKESCDTVANFIDYEIVNDEIEDLQNAIIQHGPLYASIDWYTDLETLGSEVYYKKESSVPDGRHALVIVGWNDDNNCWIVKNSAKFWSGDGYGLIGYGEIDIEYDAAYVEIDYEAEPYEPEPDLDVSTNYIDFGEVKGGQTYTKTFKLKNDGDPESVLYWTVDKDNPNFGYNWKLKDSSGSSVASGNIDGGDYEVLKIEFTADKDRNVDFSGSYKFYDYYDPSDYETISIVGYTAKSAPRLLNFNIFGNYPLLKTLFETLLEDLR